MTQPRRHASRGMPAVGRLFESLRHLLLGEPPGSNGTAPALKVRVRCAKCGEIITTRVDKANDLQGEFPEAGSEAELPPHPIGYTLTKEVVGRNCQNLVRFTMRFDEHRRVIRGSIEGGEFIGWEDTQ